MELYFDRPLFVIRFIQMALSLVLMLQTFEFFQLLSDMGPTEKFAWKNFRGDFLAFPKPVLAIFDFIYREPVFKILLVLRFAVCALTLIPSTLGLLPGLAFAQLIFSLIIIWRWRGAFNGGSDFMSLVLLMAVAASMLFFRNVFVAKAAIWYVAVQVSLSYFMAGAAKVQRADWLSGQALKGFLKTSIYAEPIWLRKLAMNSLCLKLATWGFLFFEILFPFSLLKPHWCLGFLFVGALFHLSNFIIFGLNRFFWIWLVAYPAVYCSSLLLLRH